MPPPSSTAAASQQHSAWDSGKEALLAASNAAQEGFIEVINIL